MKIRDNGQLSLRTTHETRLALNDPSKKRSLAAKLTEYSASSFQLESNQTKSLIASVIALAMDVNDNKKKTRGGGGGGFGGAYTKKDLIISSGGAGDQKPIASLKNQGNTCYLNSIIYILRFTSGFLHNLHHVIDESGKVLAAIAPDAKAKSSSLGRNAICHYGANSSRSNSTKDLLSVGFENGAVASPKHKVLSVTERLHDVFATLHGIENDAKRLGGYDAYLPDGFLKAVREANPIFCSNDQQDAHELLLYLFDNIRDTCHYIDEQIARAPTPTPNDKVTSTNKEAKNMKWATLFTKKKEKKVEDNFVNVNAKDKDKDKDKDIEKLLNETSVHSDSDSDDASSISSDVQRKAHLQRCLLEDFRGSSVRRTKCVECENITQCKEQFYEIAVPIRELTKIDRQRSPSELYREACLAPETLRGSNKYFCNDCYHLEEAVRSIAYERLPNILILQQKRFMHSPDGFAKLNTYMPTPLLLDCFCESCLVRPLHTYKLRGVVMHVGNTMQSGHYKSYVAASEHRNDYANCRLSTGYNKKGGNSCSSSAFALFSKRHKYVGGATAGLFPVSNELCLGRYCCSIKMNLNLGGVGEDVWLECNDEKVRPITVDEVENELAYRTENTNTPYLLFYEKIKI